MTRKMKDSGIEWIGEIPEDWITIKLLFVLDRPITDGPHETPSYTEEGVPFITINNIDDDGNIDKEKANKISKIDAINYNKKAKMKIGDLLFSKSATIGRVSEVDKLDFMVWSPFAIISTKENLLHNKYLKFILSLPGFIDHLIGLGSVNTQINIGMRDMEKSIIPLPNLKKQILISSYLEEKTEEIKKLKDTVNKEIETLEDYKKSVITEAVTKGLDKNVPMKDSGIGWVGQIPVHWNLRKLKFSFKFYAGGDIDNSDFSPVETQIHKYPILANSLENKGVIGYMSKYRFKENTITVTGRGEVGVAYPRFMKYFPVVRLLVGVPITKIDVRYSSYCINSFIVVGEQTAMTQLTTSKIGEYTIPNPSFEEQIKIADYLDNKCQIIDETISLKQKQLETLEEYKKSLIYEYVTGKKEVKDGEET